jgi:hypothetical protein
MNICASAYYKTLPCSIFAVSAVAVVYLLRLGKDISVTCRGFVCKFSNPVCEVGRTPFIASSSNTRYTCLRCTKDYQVYYELSRRV